MDDATVLRACRLLHEALCGDLELKRFVVHVERDRVSITIQSKRGRQESEVVVGEDSTTENVRCLTSGGSVTSDYRGGQRSRTRMPWRNV
jgi:hypothetical protein